MRGYNSEVASAFVKPFYLERVTARRGRPSCRLQQAPKVINAFESRRRWTSFEGSLSSLKRVVSYHSTFCVIPDGPGVPILLSPCLLGHQRTGHAIRPHICQPRLALCRVSTVVRHHSTSRQDSVIAAINGLARFGGRCELAMALHAAGVAPTTRLGGQIRRLISAFCRFMRELQRLLRASSRNRHVRSIDADRRGRITARFEAVSASALVNPRRTGGGGCVSARERAPAANHSAVRRRPVATLYISDAVNVRTRVPSPRWFRYVWRNDAIRLVCCDRTDMRVVSAPRRVFEKRKPFQGTVSAHHRRDRGRAG
jgi:hypothetical protein